MSARGEMSLYDKHVIRQFQFDFVKEKYSVNYLNKTKKDASLLKRKNRIGKHQEKKTSPRAHRSILNFVETPRKKKNIRNDKNQTMKKLAKRNVI